MYIDMTVCIPYVYARVHHTSVPITTPSSVHHMVGLRITATRPAACNGTHALRDM